MAKHVDALQFETQTNIKVVWKVKASLFPCKLRKQLRFVKDIRKPWHLVAAAMILGIILREKGTPLFLWPRQCLSTLRVRSRSLKVTNVSQLEGPFWQQPNKLNEISFAYTYFVIILPCVQWKTSPPVKPVTYIYVKTCFI